MGSSHVSPILKWGLILFLLGIMIFTHLQSGNSWNELLNSLVDGSKGWISQLSFTEWIVLGLFLILHLGLLFFGLFHQYQQWKEKRLRKEINYDREVKE